MVTQEIELKFAATPRTLGRLLEEPLLGEPHGEAQDLVAVYFDTPRFALWRRGIALRLRREHGRWVQCIKYAGTVQGGLHRRIEVEHPATGPAPDLSLLDDPDLRARVTRAAGTAALAEAYRVEVTRHSRLASPAPGVSIEVCLDRGVIRAGKRRTPVSEVEFELKGEGPAWRLYPFALAIAARYPVRVEQRSKAERGHALASGAQPEPVRARLAVVRPTMSANDAFKAICWTCLNHLQANVHGASLGADPEFLHQARVALRRLRSGLGAFEKLFPAGSIEPHARAVRRLTRALGPARDWDVFAEEVLAPVAQQFPGHRGLEALERASVRLRQAANRAARRALRSRSYQRLLLGFAAWLGEAPWLGAEPDEVRQAWEAPVREHAVAILDRYHRRLLKRGRGVASLSLPRLHRLRIAAKKFRYAAGFFALLFPRKRVEPMLDALNDLQNVLGAINDCAAAPAMIDAAVAAGRGPLRPQARLFISHWNAAVLAKRRAALKRVWRTLRATERFWR